MAAELLTASRATDSVITCMLVWCAAHLRNALLGSDAPRQEPACAGLECGPLSSLGSAEVRGGDQSRRCLWNVFVFRCDATQWCLVVFRAPPLSPAPQCLSSARRSSGPVAGGLTTGRGLIFWSFS